MTHANPLGKPHFRLHIDPHMRDDVGKWTVSWRDTMYGDDFTTWSKTPEGAIAKAGRIAPHRIIYPREQREIGPQQGHDGPSALPVVQADGVDPDPAGRHGRVRSVRAALPHETSGRKG